MRTNLPVVKGRIPTIHFNLLDRIIQVVSPVTAMRRARSRMILSALGTTGFVTPGKNKRSMRGWFTSSGSADVDTLTDLPSSRRGSRDLYMNTPVAVAALRRLKTNVIGSGLILQSRINREVLGLTDEQAAAWERKTESLWKLWAGSKDCDISRTMNFFQLQQLAFLSYNLSGDVLALLPHKKVKGFPFNLRVQLIEGDRLSNPNNLENPMNHKIRGGVEVDADGAPVAYHIQSSHPGDAVIKLEWRKISAFGSRSGRRNVLHIYDKERPGQRRGMPFLAPVMEQLKQLTRFSEAELMAALVNSFFTVFVTTTTGEGLEQGFVPDTQKVSDGTVDEDQVYEMGHGNIVQLADDEKVDLADPKRPNDSFEPFFLAIVKQIGAALEIPFELLMLHFTASYSASRAAILEGWKTFRPRRNNFTIDFNQPIYEEWLTDAVIKGFISAPGFLTNPELKAAWCGTRWNGPGQGQIDPMKETKASLLRVQGRLSTYEDESQLIGNGDWETSMDRLAREKQTLRDKDLEPEVEVKAEGTPVGGEETQD